MRSEGKLIVRIFLVVCLKYLLGHSIFNSAAILLAFRLILDTVQAFVFYREKSFLISC